MRNLRILIFALMAALFISEMFVRFIIGYPEISENKKYYLKPGLRFDEYLLWEVPYNKFWSVEGGNKVFTLNNIGLPGSDVKIDTSMKDIILIGDSFIKSRQLDKEIIASSIFQKKIPDSLGCQVLNLGSSGRSLYANWFRAVFFNRFFPVDYVIIVIEELNCTAKYLQRYSYYDFKIPENFGKEVTQSFSEITINKIVRHSSLLSLYYTSWWYQVHEIQKLPVVFNNKGSSASFVNEKSRKGLELILSQPLKTHISFFK